MANLTTTAPAWKVFGARGLVPRGDQFDTHCPSHDDKKKSLSLSIADDGKILLRCFCGCPAVTIVESIGLTMQDLYPPDDKPYKPQRNPFTATYDYFDETGTLLYQVVREDPKGFKQRTPNPDGSWTWKLGPDVRRVLYRLPELIESKDRVVMLVEGEKDVASLEALGFVATTCAGGAGAWRPEYGKQLKGRHVVILPDNDAPGLAFAASAAAYLESALVVLLPVNEKQDVSDWITAGGTTKELRALVVEAARQTLARSQRMLDKLTGVK